MTTVLIGVPHGGAVHGRFAQALLDLQRFELASPDPAYTLLPITLRQDLYIHENRNQLVRAAQAAGADWLLQLDPDETFPPEVLRVLMRSANPATRPVITGHYANVAHLDSDGFGASTVVDMVFAELASGEYTNVIPPNDVTPFPVDAMGAGILLTHCTVYGRLEYPWFENVYILPYGKTEPQLMNEDLAFARKLREAGIPIWCDPLAGATHWKTVPLTPSTTRRYLEQVRAASAASAAVTA